MPNKAEFIEELAGRLQTDKKQAGMILDTVLDSIYAARREGGKGRTDRLRHLREAGSGGAGGP